jgi:uncharacterized protein
MRGLLGREAEQFRYGKGLWIVPSQGVHTFGMKYPIDVAYLDSDKRVIKLCHQVSPFRFTALKLKSHSVVELPSGVLEQTQTSVGDILLISRIETEGD